MDKHTTLAGILRHGLVPVLLQDKLPPLQCLEQMLEVGLGAVEISCRHPEALQLIALTKRQFPDLAVGAATLVEEGRLRQWIVARGHPLPSIQQVVEAGADFLVSLLPFREATYANFAPTRIIVSGVSTPGEAHQALDWGANLLKFTNPHLIGGPDFFRGLDPATYGTFPYVVSGGMRANVAAGYIEAGVLAVAAGMDQILGAEYTALQEAYDEYVVREKLSEYVATIARARGRAQPHVPYESGDLMAIQQATGRCLNL